MNKNAKKNIKTQTLVTICPCGSARPYADCCDAMHSGAKAAQSAEQLMRSRYCAYVLGYSDYLLASWHESTRPEQLDLNAAPRPHWQNLTIVNTAPSLANGQSGEPQTAYVEFIARFKSNGRAQRLHERSRFVFEQGRWFYVDGVFLDASAAHKK